MTRHPAPVPLGARPLYSPEQIALHTSDAGRISGVVTMELGELAAYDEDQINDELNFRLSGDYIVDELTYYVTGFTDDGRTLHLLVSGVLVGQDAEDSNAWFNEYGEDEDDDEEDE